MSTVQTTTNLEDKSYQALKKMLGIKHRIAGCPDKGCQVCVENAETIKLMEDAVVAYEAKRHGKS